jgi:DNA-binding transcriptional MerR regulator
MRIGELARATDTPVETIRFYEREGLLPAAARTENGYRHYGSVARERLEFIRTCRALDMPLADVRRLIALGEASPEDCHAATDVVDAQLARVRERIAQLARLERALTDLRRRCDGQHGPGAAAHCGILQDLAHVSPAGTPRAAIRPRRHR